MKKLVNIEKSFKMTRLLVLVFGILVLILISVVVFKSFAFANEQRQKIYVLDNGNSLLLALAKDMNDNRPVEARDHVKTFHQLFFGLDPDPKAIQANMEKAFFFCDESPKKEYENLKEKGYYNQIVSANISQKLEPDSIIIDINTYPYYVKYYGKETITRSSNVTVRSLISECYLRNVQRTDNNPHGFLIEKWQVLANTDISSTVR